MERYHYWLVVDRALAARTIGRYEVTARRFLETRQQAGQVTGVEGLSGADVTAFLLGECSRLAVGSAQGSGCGAAIPVAVLPPGRLDANGIG